MNKRAPLPALLCAFTGSSFASDWDTHILPWEEENPLSTLTIKIKGEDFTTATIVGAEVAHSHQGAQRLYINFIKMDKAKACDPSDTPRTATIRVNNQPVRMIQTCHLEEGLSLLQTTAQSDKGVNFIINAFRNSPDTVRIEHGSFEADLSAVGFTKAWEQGGGDAL
ncbi:hypothetical protein [Photobacterium lutimaris]|uniref:Uncharacterized protein n=1 Tax=Photobacterium lutimaris TaxID=388278 RepID=A0A2T3J1N2_9GAMM|nr:hypothetical protein [Photobacterium lutimaris]PSU34985.1 hypothetical protein C9I99_07915 [Photobacterium lutimaris]TDR77340.1 hypothetical protein DFP78_102357 [Photobacterium lutimaris]